MFINSFCRIHDPLHGEWRPFHLWPSQQRVLDVLISAQPEHRQVVILKARQLGQTWLALAWLLHVALFRAHSTILLFSRRDAEAMDLLSRMVGMYERLPEIVRHGNETENRSAHRWQLVNGSRVLAFPTGTGDSYTATAALIDEADLVPDLNGQLQSVKPTTDAGGKLVLLSRSDKSKPQSSFKTIFREAHRSQGASGWWPIFLSWRDRPDRTDEWYESMKRESLSRTGALDELHEQYPAEAEEALAAAVLDKRFPSVWLRSCYHELAGVLAVEWSEPRAPSLPALRIFSAPSPGRRYVIGADPAEGNPTSDESALDVVDVETGEQVATYHGRFEPAVFASAIDVVSRYYNGASAMIERNNHGHAVLLWLADHSDVYVLRGLDDKPGWLTTSRSKSLLWDGVAEALRAGHEGRWESACVIHDYGTLTQLSGIEGATHQAPDGEHDDRAVSLALALAGARAAPRGTIDVYFGPKELS